MIKGLYGSSLNVLYLMLNRTLVATLIFTVVAILLYLVGNIPIARNISQLSVLVFIPFLTVLSARTAYSSKWNVFEQQWSTPPALMIVSRYMVFAVINLIVSVVWYISPLFDGSYSNLVHTMGSAYLALAIYYPMMYLLRGEKGDLDQIILAVAVIGSMTGLNFIGLLLGNNAMIIVVVGMYLISLGLSIIINNFHKGRA